MFSEVFSFREEDELSDDDLSLMELRTIFFIDDTSLQTTFDVDEFSFEEELLSAFCEWTPDDTVRVFCFRERLSCWSLVVTIGSDSECRDFFVSGSCFYEWIFGNISDEDNFINSSHNRKKKENKLILDFREHITPNIFLDIKRVRNLKKTTISFTFESVEEVISSI
jgi:hypothetical protein